MSNSLNIGEKIKYVFGALEIAKRNREGRELEIIKSANRMVEQLETELADKEKQFADALDQIGRLQVLGKAMNKEIERKDKLIEQMRGALKAIDGIGREAGNARHEDALRCFAIAAAALTAERGEDKLQSAAQKLLDIAPEYNNGCGCCASLSMDQTDEYKELAALVAERGE